MQTDVEQPPKYPEIPEAAGKTEEELDQAWAVYWAAIDPWRKAMRGWEAKLKPNEPLLFETDNMLYLITRDPIKNWRATSFSKSLRCPWGHVEYRDRFEALMEHHNHTRIADFPFIPERDPIPQIQSEPLQLAAAA